MPTNKTASDVFKEKVEEHYRRNKRSIRKNDFDIFHFSAQQKLWQSDYYFQRIMDIYNSETFVREFINTINVQTTDHRGVAESSTTKYEIDKVKLVRHCNLYIDGYFSSVSSIFDSLAHEVNILFKLLRIDQDIYIGTILNELKQKHPKSEFYKFLVKQRSKRWWRIMDNFRNALIHESIVATNIETTTNVPVGREELKKIALPDNPKRRPFTYKKDCELRSFVENFHKNIPPVLEQCYKKITKDLKKSGKLPIKV